MKKILLLALLFTATSFPQLEILPSFDENGIFANDSLYNTYIDTVGVDDTTSACTYKTLTLKYRYDYMTIAMKDTGAAYDDSIRVEYTHPDSDVWYPVHSIKDSTDSTVVQPIVDDDSQHSYLLFVGSYWRIRISLINTEAYNNRVFYFKLQAAKKLY